MLYRRLGRTDLRVSVIGIGTWQFGGEWAKQFDQPEVDRMLTRAGELGINLIDTAECYGDHRSESLVGAAIERRRDRWIVATKFGHRFRKPFERDNIFDADGVRRQLEDSLRAWRTDYVDLYQFHSGTDELFDNDALWTMLGAQVRAGKVRHLGVSITKKGSMHQAAHAHEHGAGALQLVYNRLQRLPEEGMFAEATRHDLGVLARVPLASGFLTGKYDPSSTFDASDVREAWMKDQRDGWLKEVEQIRRSELPEGVPMAHWALAWCLKHPAVTATIPGCKNIEQVESNAAAAAHVDPDHSQACPAPDALPGGA